MIYRLIVVGAILAIYGGLVEHPFQFFDDPVYVTNNYYVQNGLTWEGIGWAFRSLDGANWHPLTWLSHMLDVEVFGPKPAGHYLSNVVLHIAASLLLFGLIWRIGRNELMAFGVALIWAVHPANVECVAWISERKTLLATTLMLAGMIAYYRYREVGDRRYYLLSFVAHILACMAKPIAVLFPVALVLMDGLTMGGECPSVDGSSVRFGWSASWALVKQLATSIRSKIPFIAIAGYLSILTFVAQDKTGATGYTYELGIGWRCGNALQSLLAYTARSLSTTESSVLYLLKPLDGLRVFLGALLAILFLLEAMACFRRRRIVTIGLLWYLLMFLPTIGLVQVGSQRMADRYLGLPLIGLICVICYGGAILLRRTGSRVLPTMALGAWALALGLQARALCVDWEDDMRLSINAMRVGGRSSSMLINGAVAAAQRNDIASARRFLNAAPDRELVAVDDIVIYVLEKKYDVAIARARLLYADKKNRLMAAAFAGQAFDGLGRPGDAIRAYKAAISYLPPERSYMLSIERLRVVLPQLLAAATAKEEELATSNDQFLRWRMRKRMELNR